MEERRVLALLPLKGKLTRKFRAAISVVVPAFNEVDVIECIVEGCLRYAGEVIVVDDGSWDGTGMVAEEAGAKVLYHKGNKGVNEALKTGFREARGEVVVRVDGDGQHDPAYIPLLVEPIASGKADLVVGRRSSIPLFELLISALLWPIIRVHDAGSGFIAIRRELARRLTLEGRSTCGTLLLEAAAMGARIREIPVPVYPRINGERRLRASRLKHLLTLLKHVIRFCVNRAR